MSSPTLIIGDGNWAVKSGSLLGYEYGELSGQFAPIPITGSRASTATYTNQSGLIVSASNDVLRVDYSTGTGSLLLEPQRTNLFSNSVWAGGGTTPTGWNSFITGTTTAVTSIKNNNVTAYRFSGTSQRAFFVQAGVPTTIGLTYSISIFIESVTTTQNLDQVMSNFAGGVFYRNGVIVSGTTPIEAGYTYTAVFSATTTSYDIRFGLGVQGPNTGNFVMSMPQFEQGAYSTTYIPTTGTTVTRIADTFSRPNIYTDGVITSGGGTWFVSLLNNIIYIRDGIVRLGVGDTSALTTNSLYLSGGYNTRNGIYKIVSGSSTLLYNTTTNIAKIAIKWNGTTADIFENGSKVVSATSFTATNMENFIGGNGVSTFIPQMKFYNQPLSDAECISLTTL